MQRVLAKRAVTTHTGAVPGNRSKSRQNNQQTRDLYTPEPVRQRVLARHLSGESNRGIAEGEGIGRDTVARILGTREVIEMISSYQSQLLSMVPKAIAVYDQALYSDDERVRIAAATRLLESTGVRQKGGLERALENGAALQRDREQQRLVVLGQLTDAMLNKAQKYGVPLPTGYESLDAAAGLLPKKD